MESNSQTLAASYRYDAFGNTLASSGALASSNTYRFSSKEFIPTAGFYYYLYRFYDPVLQRWINRDPYGEPGFEAEEKIFATPPSEDGIQNDTFNPYLLVNNMVANFVDIYDLTWWKPWTWKKPKWVPPWQLTPTCTASPGGVPTWATPPKGSTIGGSINISF